MTFLTVVLPVVSVFVVGFISQKRLKLNVRTLSVMALYLMSPFLAFRTFFQNEIGPTYIYLTIYILLLCFTIIFLAVLIGWLRGYNRHEICGMMLATAFMNNGNYGTPVALFAFGAAGMDYAVILLVIHSILMSTLGVYIAAKGSKSGGDVKGSALLSVLRMPIAYGAVLGLVWQVAQLPMPKPMFDAISLIADAAIPTIMLILGMQLANIKIVDVPLEKVSIAIIVRMLVSPMIALIITLVLPVNELLQQIMILMAAMPTAANTTLFSLQFHTEPELVSTTTLFTTITSIITLPIWLILII